MISLLLIAVLNGQVATMHIENFATMQECKQYKKEFQVIRKDKNVSLSCVRKL